MRRALVPLLAACTTDWFGGEGLDRRRDAAVAAPGADAGFGPGGGPPRSRDGGPTCQPIERLDLLFVVDNSSSMGDDQDRLAEQFAVLARAIEDPEFGFPDAHIGVVSSDMGAGPYFLMFCDTPDLGELQAAPRGDCVGPAPEPFLTVRREGDALTANVPDVARPVADGAGAAAGCAPGGDGAIDACDVAAGFACIARLGADGCGFEQPLEAARQALAGPNVAPGAPNAGFLRDDALLAIVFIGDEDDCSVTDPALFDPRQRRLDDPLGPLESFRCFEFGMRCGDRCAHAACAEPIPRAAGQILEDCRPVDLPDLADGESPWLRPVSGYASFFSDLRPGRVIVAAITGPFSPGDVVHTIQDGRGHPDIAASCEGEDGDNRATPPPRLRALVDAFGRDGLFGADQGASLCSSDFTPALSIIGRRIRASLWCGPD